MTSAPCWHGCGRSKPGFALIDAVCDSPTMGFGALYPSHAAIFDPSAVRALPAPLSLRERGSIRTMRYS